MESNNNGYFKGKVDRSLEFNDKEHEKIYKLVEKLRNDIVMLQIKASLWGSIGGGLVLFGFVLIKLWLDKT
uniref:Uncharacterized protein n=1 Tax=viral metagenome TaxID=1070528 RepID=A0A6M3K2C5_9ZZZZ